MSRFPTGVAVIGTLDAKGGPVGMTCSSLASVCTVPPTLLVCMRTTGTTLRATLQQGAFSVNLLRDSGQCAAEVFAANSADRFDHVTWRWSPGGMPWLDDTVAAADCAVRRFDEVGDHTVVFGEVTHVALANGKPLLHGMRKFFSRLRPSEVM